MVTSEQGDERAGDRVRDSAIEQLNTGLAEGMLTHEEYSIRLDSVAEARTVAQVRELTADLPAGRAAVREDAASRRRHDLQAWLREWRYWLGTGIIMCAVWGVQSVRDGDLRPFWPAMPLAIWAAVLIAVAIWPSKEGEGRP